MIRENTSAGDRKTIVVIGHGMVGHRFCEKMIEYDVAGAYRLVTFCEEPRAAYDRVGLTSFFAHRDAEQLMLARMEWYEEQGIELHIGDLATGIDREARKVVSAKGLEIDYDYVVLATGSYPFVPPIEGVGKQGVFVYRTIEDLDRIIEYAGKVKTAAVIGGGLLGLEAAKACVDLGLKTHVVENSAHLMARQLDETGARYLQRSVQELGVELLLEKLTSAVLGEGAIEGLAFADGSEVATEMLVVAAGIRPRDELATECGLELGERGGVLVDDALQTSDPAIFAIGEVASHRAMTYGLVAPGYDMAEIVAGNLCGEDSTFEGGDMSAKLKLMGCDVASFGDTDAGPDSDAMPMVYEDPFKGIYKKLFFDASGTRLRGGILVGEANDYQILQALTKSDAPLTMSPSDLIGMGGEGSALGSGSALPDDAQVCTCNMVTKGGLCSAIQDNELRTLDDVKRCTNAGTGCGGCIPLVTDLFQEELKKAGVTVVNHLCEHFAFSRKELFDIVRIKELKSFNEVIEDCGKGYGCEICKPTIASILASLWNDHIVEHDTIQDTNDRFLANIQRQGLYSVVPRVAAGEIQPEQLVVLGEVAKKYDLYSKVTGGQRIDLFGARVHQLPDIWEDLIGAGFESGHAYGKSLRTVKSCVGSTWCRFGVQDSVGFAIRVENRYKGVRSPHKLKGGVSGCTRECAEAQSKDFGLIATEKGWNIYVCGNGGTKPRHADLLISDVDDDTTIKLLDRFLMYYIHTADKLTRTSVWLEKLEGGIDYVRDVVVHDKLGICDQLESDMQRLIDTYKCEWTEVVNNPEKRKKFTHFANSPALDDTVFMQDMRGQKNPTDWTEFEGNVERATSDRQLLKDAPKQWVRVAAKEEVPHDGGITIPYGAHQIALYHFAGRDEWYACQNMCPHKRDMVLARGIVGESEGTPKVACPMHKKTFNLQTGEGMSDPNYQVVTFEVAIKGPSIFLFLPSEDVLDKLDMMNPERVACGGCTGCGS